MAFEKKKKNEQLSITYDLKSNLTAELAVQIVADIREELSRSREFELIVFDFGYHGLQHQAFRVLSPIGVELRRMNKQLYALSDLKSVHSLIKQEGMDTVFKPIKSLNEITSGSSAAKSAKAPPKLDVSFINPFLEGTIHVLNVQCKTQATPMKPTLKSKGDFECPTDIAGIIGITSKSFHGSIAICFPAKVFLDLMSKMLGEEFNEINDDLKDGAGELTNMIFGHAKRVLNDAGHTIEKALPSVVRGPNLKIDHSGSSDSVILPFSVGDAFFYIEIGSEQI